MPSNSLTHSLTILSAFLFVLHTVVPPVAAADQWIQQDRYDQLHLITPAQHTPPEAYAAQEFARYWQTLTGHTPTFGREREQGKVNVWIGNTPNPFLSEGLADLSEDGVLIRTVSLERTVKRRRLHTAEPRTDHLIIAGGGPRGTLYAVYQFLEDYMGVRWLSPEATHLPPPPPALPHIDFRYEPAFAYRDLSYRSYIDNPAFAVINRLNGHWTNTIPIEWGGNIAFARGWPGYGHTFHLHVPKRIYWSDHPEYYSEVNGVRINRQTQLCLTNPDVLTIVTESVRRWLREAPPNVRIVSVSQMDWDNWCACEACKAVDDYEESHSGTIIRFVNAVAEAIADEFPDAFVDTFAYQYSRKPPKHIRPRDNVIVRVTSLECDFSTPITDAGSTRNSAFRMDLKGWAPITKNLYVWDYTQNWYAFQGPHPNIHVLQPNIKFYRDQGVVGLYEQASAFSPHSDFEHLKGYILAHALWNPHVDWRVLYDEFLALYYKTAAPYIDEYLRLITDRVRRRDVVMSMFNSISWMNYDLVTEAQEIFKRAFAHIHDEETLRRLKYAYLPVQYAALVCPPVVRFEGDHYTVTRPPSQTYDEYWNMIQEYGVTHLADYPIDNFAKRLRGVTPPRYQEIPIEKIQNDAYEAWILPSEGGRVVRLYDKNLRRELLDGYENISRPHGAIGLWQRPTRIGPFSPDPLTLPVDVIDRTPNALRMTVTLDSGLLVRQEIRLAPGSPKLIVRFHLHNDTTEPLRPFLEVRASFTVPSTRGLQILRHDKGIWNLWPLKPVANRDMAFDQRASQTATALAFRLPRKKRTVINTIEEGAVESVGYYVRNASGRVDLFAHLTNDPLDPGETATLTLSYQSSGPIKANDK